MSDPGKSPNYVNVLGAYRDDTASREGMGLGPAEGAWIEFGVLLSHAAYVPQDARDAALTAARSLGRELLDATTWDEGHRLDPSPPLDAHTLNGRIRSIAEEVEDVGALRLADAILVAFLAAHPDCDVIERGRIEAARARIAWKSGDIDNARERYARVRMTGDAHGSDELRVRAMIGDGILARLSGNYPKSDAKARAAAKLAETAGTWRLAALAHHTVMVAAAVRGAFGEAIEYGWQAYLRSNGDFIFESQILGNIGQMFLDLGDARTAFAAFTATIRREPPPRVLMPALGGLAIAAARVNNRAALERAADRINARIATMSHPFVVAETLIELSDAYAIVGSSELSRRYRSEALNIAKAGGYHELVHRAETVEPQKPLERTLEPHIELVADAVRELVEV